MAFDHGGTIYATARALGCAVEEILDLSASINPLGVSPVVRQAIISAIGQLPHYPDPDAALLTEALAAYHQVSQEVVVTANGSTALIHLIPAVMPGKRAMIVAPAFNEYERGLQRHGYEVVRHILSSSDDFTLDIVRLGDDIRRLRPDLLFFCTPSNPAGLLYGADCVTALLQLCRENNIMLVLDEAFMDFCGEEHSAKQAVVASGQGIVLRSMTKFHALAGLRLGCALAAPALAARFRAAQPPWEVNSLAQTAGVAARQDADYAVATRRLIDGERALLAEGLEALPGLRLFPSRVNYLLFELTSGQTAPQLAERLLLRHRIMVRDCSGFAGLGERFLRVAVRSREENGRLLKVLQEELA